jgi:hypothetical protein
MHRSPTGIGFALVDLVVTLVLIVTLSGLAALYYRQAQDERQRGVVANELDEYVKAAEAWELSHRRQLTITDVEDAMKKRGTILHEGHKTGTLDFLVEDGRFQEITQDPWKQDYIIDPFQGTIYSLGPDKVLGGADVIRSYRRLRSAAPSLDAQDTKPCRVPPVIASFEPCETVLKDGRPLIRATYYASAGCGVDLEKTDLFVDQNKIGAAIKSAGQVIYQPEPPLADGKHDTVLVVKDTAGNETRKQCSFLVDTSPAIVLLTSPPSGRALSGAVRIEGAVIDKALKSWTLTWDFRELARGEAPVGRQDADTRIYPDVIVERFDTVDPGNRVEDGRHFITLQERDAAGQILTSQSEVTVDNNAPKLLITKRHPGAQGNPMVVTTDIPRFVGVANDNLMVREVKFVYIERNTGLPAQGQPMGGTTAVPVKWDPLDLTTSRNWAALFNAPIVEWGTVPSRGTTQQQKDAGFTPVTLVPGEFRLEATARDLAGNKSTVATTDFNVNLFTGGISGPIFLDLAAQSRQPPYYEEDRHISSLPLDVNFGPPANQRKGAVRFVVLESSATSTDASCKTTAGSLAKGCWEVVIDDNGGSDLYSGDGAYVTTPTVSDRDWVARGPLPRTTAEKILTASFEPDGANPYESATTNKQRRTKVVLPVRSGTMAEGVYKIRVRYSNDLGTVRTQLTTFYLDRSRPLIPKVDPVDEKFIEYRVFNGGGPRIFQTLQPVIINSIPTRPVIRAFSQPEPDTGQIEFRGSAKDYPTTGVITEIRWNLTQTPPPSGPTKVLVGDTAVYRATGSARRTNVATYGYSPAGLSEMQIASTTPGALDGDGYKVQVTATDGAGHTTSALRDFMINTAGPLVRGFTIKNARGGVPVVIEPASGDLPVVHEVDGQRVEVSFSVVDETPIKDVRYNVFVQRGSSGPGLPTQVRPIIGVLTREDISLTISKDDESKDFGSLPTTYQVRVVGNNGDRDGVTFATAVGFRFLTNMAIVAPYYTKDTGRVSTFRTLASTNVSWLSMDEQIAIADFVFANVQSAGIKKIFNFSGQIPGAAQSTIAGDTDTLTSWIDAATSNQTTDVLVVLDVFPKSIWDNRNDATVKDKIVRFMESKSTNAAKAGNTKDGDALVWVGEMPFAWVVDDVGRRQKALGSNSATDGHRTFFGIPGTVPDLLYQVPKITAAGDPAAVQELTPSGNGSAFLPGLFGYDPFVDFASFPGGTAPFERQLRNENRPLGGIAISGVRWGFNRLFSVDLGLVDRAALPGESLAGANFQFRNLDSGATMAHLLSCGTDAPVVAFPTVTAGPRRPIPATGPVIRDYIDKYLLNATSPQEASRRIYFNALSSTTFGGTGAGGRDVVFWPTRSEGYGNATTITAASQDAVLQAVSAAEGALFTADKQTQVDATFDFGNDSLFLYPPGRIQLVQKVSVAPVLEAAIAANGTVLAFATRTAVLANPDGTTALAAPAIFYKKVGLAATAITTGNGANVDESRRPRLSSGGEFCVFDSLNVYNALTLPPNFSGLVKTATPRIYRYAGNRPANDVYFDSEVSRTRLGAVAECRRPVVSKDGRFVVFEATNAILPKVATANPKRQIALAYNKTPGGADPWVIGAITSDTAGDCSLPDMSGDVVNFSNYPYIVFESVVNYENVFPSLANGAGVEVTPNSLAFAEGAVAVATPKVDTPPKASIYLFSGSFAQRLQRIATGSDAPCTNPRISPDGDEVVFESRAIEVSGFFADDGSTVIAQKIRNPSGGATGPRRVYRIRIRPVKSGSIEPSAIIQRITPAATDVGTDAVPMATN